MKPSFHRRTDLALKALRALSGAGEPVPGSELAAATGTTVTFLPQVMGPLVRNGWVSSLRGPGGGYSLTGAATQASLLEVIEATEGPADDGVCVVSGGPCPGMPACPVHPVWTAAREVLIEGFSSVPVLSGEMELT